MPRLLSPRSTISKEAEERERKRRLENRAGEQEGGRGDWSSGGEGGSVRQRAKEVAIAFLLSLRSARWWGRERQHTALLFTFLRALCTHTFSRMHTHTHRQNSTVLWYLTPCVDLLMSDEQAFNTHTVISDYFANIKTPTGQNMIPVRAPSHSSWMPEVITQLISAVTWSLNGDVVSHTYTDWDTQSDPSSISAHILLFHVICQGLVICLQSILIWFHNLVFSLLGESWLSHFEYIIIVICLILLVHDRDVNVGSFGFRCYCSSNSCVAV